MDYFSYALTYLFWMIVFALGAFTLFVLLFLSSANVYEKTVRAIVRKQRSPEESTDDEPTWLRKIRRRESPTAEDIGALIEQKEILFEYK